MSVLHEFMHKFNAIAVKLPDFFVCTCRQIIQLCKTGGPIIAVIEIARARL